MKSIDRIDQQPTAVDQPLLRLRNVYQDRRSGKDRRMGVTHMDPALDRRKGERRNNARRGRDRRAEVIQMDCMQDRRKSERRKKFAWLFK
jgi:thymidine kinase